MQTFPVTPKYFAVQIAIITFHSLPEMNRLLIIFGRWFRNLLKPRESE